MHMIFDQYSRYAALVRLLRHIGSRGATILDVGSGPECLLGAMIEDASVTYVDPLITSLNDKSHVTGDVHSPLLFQRSFEIVCAVDVLEHVHPDSREDFLKRLSSLATNGLVIGFPTSDSAHSSEVDAVVNDAYKQAYGNDYPWLAEHFSNGLPSVASTCDRLKQLGWHCQTIGHGYVPWLKELLSEVVCYWDIPECQRLVLDASDAFNMDLADHDFLPPHYRTFILASRGPLPPYRVKGIADAKKKKLMHRFREIFDSMKSRYATNSLALLKSQQHEILDLNARLREISNWGQSSSADVASRDAVVLQLTTKNTELSDWAKSLADNLKDRDTRVQLLSEKIEELTAWGNKLGKEVAFRDASILALNATLTELSTWSASLTEALKDRDARAMELGQKNAELASWGNQLSTEIASRDTLVLELNSKVSELAEWSAMLATDLKNRDAHIIELLRKNEELSLWGNKLAEDIAERDTRVMELNSIVAELTTWSQKLATDLGDRDSRVLELSRSNESLSKWAETQGRDIALRDSQVTDLTRKVDELSSWGTQQSVVLKERDARIDDLGRKSNELADRVKDLSTSLANKNVQLEALNLTIGDLVRREKELELHMLDGTARIDELLMVIADAESSREALRVQLGMKDHLIDTLRNDAAETKLTLAAKHAELMKMSDWAQGIHKELKAIKARPHMKLVGHARNAGAAVRNTISSSFVGDLVRHVRDSKRYRKHMVSFEALRTSLAKCDGRLLVTFPIITWDFRWQRPQHIVSRLRDNGYSVVYLAMSLTPLQRRFRSYREAGAALQFNALAADVSQIWLHSRQPVNVYVDPLVGDDLANIVDGMVALLNELKPDSITYLIQFPGWWPVAAALKEKFGGSVVFDCMDDHGGFSTNTADALKTESHLIKAADLVVTSSALLQERCSKENVNTIQIKNGTEFEHFANPKPNGLLDHLATFPVIGYYGAISDWFDMELVAYCAMMRPNWNFVLIGATFGSDLKSVETLPNVHFLGEKPYKDLPGFLAYFDVCTIPFKIIPLTLATNPVKFYEYLSAGKPVVSVKLPELVPYAENCYLAATSDEFLAQLDIALAERDDKEKISRRLDLARENSWDSRVKLLLKSAMFSQKKSD